MNKDERRIKLIRGHFQDTDSEAIVLLTAAIDEFGTDITTWLPHTIRMEIYDWLDTEDIPESNFDKLFAALSVLTSNAFFVSIPDHAALVPPLVGLGSDFEAVYVPDIEDECWAVVQAKMITPYEFSEEVKAYIKRLLEINGFLMAPEALSFVQPEQVIEDVPPGEERLTEAIRTVQIGKVKDVNRRVRARLIKCLYDLLTLPLEHGDKKIIREFSSRMMASIS